MSWFSQDRKEIAVSEPDEKEEPELPTFNDEALHFTLGSTEIVADADGFLWEVNAWGLKQVQLVREVKGHISEFAEHD